VVIVDLAMGQIPGATERISSLSKISVILADNFLLIDKEARTTCIP